MKSYYLAKITISFQLYRFRYNYEINKDEVIIMLQPQKISLMMKGSQHQEMRRVKEDQSDQNIQFSHQDTINQRQDTEQQQLRSIDLFEMNPSIQRNTKDYSDHYKSTIKKSTLYCCLSILTVLFITFFFVYRYNFSQYYPCPQKYVVSYVWVGDRAKMPQKYFAYLQRCKNTVNLLQQKHLQHYIKLWNSQQPEHQIGPQNFRPKTLIADKADLLRKLYLYYESGIYADFDTQINEQCYDGIITNEIIFTNSWGLQRNIVMAQENFIRVINKKNPYMRYWIIAQLGESHLSDRWNFCKYKPCFIINCQKHNYDRTWIG